jgi:hypothetical protein
MQSRPVTTIAECLRTYYNGLRDKKNCVPGHAGVGGNEIAGMLTGGRSVQNVVEPELSLINGYQFSFPVVKQTGLFKWVPVTTAWRVLRL